MFKKRIALVFPIAGLTLLGLLAWRMTEYLVPTPEEGSQLALSFATYLGGSGRDDCDGVAVDHSGIYLACHSNSQAFPLATSSSEVDREARWKLSTSWEQRYDAFVVKLDLTGTRVLYTTSLGGSGWEGAGAITVDASGNVYVAGSTRSPDFPTTAGAFQTSFGGGNQDVFVAKLNVSGAVMYRTYLGGSGSEGASDIAADEAGNVYVVGTTGSKDFPTSDFFVTSSALQQSLAGGADLFISQLDARASTLLYSTYLGGAGEEYDADDHGNVALDAYGHLYMAGTTESSNFPTTLQAFQKEFAGGKSDAFLTELDLANSRLVYSTYLGGSGIDGATGVGLDADGQAFVTGETDSPNLPTRKAAQPAFAGGTSDAFVVEFSQDGSAVLYATYLGGTGRESPEDIVVDVAGNLYVSGSGDSPDFPILAAIQAAAPQLAYAEGGNDIILARFDQRSPGLRQR